MNPRVTWWSQAGPFFLYLNRCQFMMQQGRSVNDVLYFYGDEVPNFVRLKRDDPAHVLPGYDYDVTNEDALLRTLHISDGNIETPAGNRYRILAMPVGARVSLASLERIAAYVREGGNIVGPMPLAPTGIVDSAAGARFSELQHALWGQWGSTVHTYGKGKVFCGSDTRAALRILGIAPDFRSDSTTIDYVHRVAGTTDIYFVRNSSASPVDAVATFRVAGRTPELWNPLDGTISPQVAYISAKGRTTLNVRLAPFGSAFFLFDQTSGPHIVKVEKDGKEVPASIVTGTHDRAALQDATPGGYTAEFSDGAKMTAVAVAPATLPLPAHQWTVTFQPGRRAPAGSQKVGAFTSWTKSPLPGIRYFSGTATYRTNIRIAKKPGESYILALTDVREICTVRINGKDAGTIWAMPFRLDVTGSLVSGENILELQVTNLWPNRIIGDAQPGAATRFTHTNILKYEATSQLLPSGLIGPVVLQTIHETTLKRL